jgi:adenylate kinase
MSRLKIYKQNAEAVSSSYSNITNKVTEDYFLNCVTPIVSTNGTFSLLTYLGYVQINGSRPKEEVFKDIESLLSPLQQDKVKIVNSGGMHFQKYISNFNHDILVGNCKFIL